MKTEGERQATLPLVALRLRALVLALGESAQPPWWKTGFMNETGFRFLERLYPRSYFDAAVHAAGRAACEVHDQAVGRTGVYHLFRLPEGLEVEIHTISGSADEEFVVQLRSHLGERDRLMEMLADAGSDKKEENDASGSRRMGTSEDLTHTYSLARVASVYHRAFNLGRPVFPYFAV